MKENISLLQIEQQILLSLAAFTRPPDLTEIAKRLGFSTNAGHIKLSFYVDNLEKDGFMRYNRAWRQNHVYNEETLGWNLTPKGRSYIDETILAA